MKAIYTLATSVVIYLGENILVDGIDVWPIPALCEASSLKINKRTDLPIRHGTRGWVRYVLSPDWTTNGDLQDKKWNAIIKSVILLLQRPWFLRTWIIQEAALAKRAVVISGDHQSDWEGFYQAISYAIDLDYFSATPPEMYSSLRRIERARQLRALQPTSGGSGNLGYDGQSPLDLLTSFRIFQATDSRDKVFGIYGLFTDEDLARLKLDQDYDLDVVQVYTQSVIDCISVDGNLDVISLGGQDCLPEHSKLPTWVPDWAYQDRAKPLHPRFVSAMSFGDHDTGGSGRIFRSATRDSKPIVSFSDDKKVITLSGYILDRVSATGGVLDKDYYDSQPGHPVLETTALIKQSTEVFTAWENICGVRNNPPATQPTSANVNDQQPPYFTGESPWDIYWKTLHAGIYHGDEHQTQTAFEKWYKPFQDLQSLSEYSSTGLSIISKEHNHAATKVIAGIGWFGKVTYGFTKWGWKLMRSGTGVVQQTNILAVHRTVFKTGECGYVGLGSRHVKVGDAVALFEGGRMPIVLREVGGGEGRKWQVVGEAYVHGVMEGGVFDAARCGGVSIC